MTNVKSDPSGRRSIVAALCLLPTIFVIHDGEELLTMPGWIARHQGVLDHLARINALAACAVHSLSATPAQIAIAIGFILLLFVTVTAGASASRRPGFWLSAYAMLLGAYFLHVFVHLAQSLVVGGYVPGLYGALFAVLPGSLYVY